MNKKGKEKEENNNLEILKIGPKIIINKNNQKRDSFEIISIEDEFHDNYGFYELSFKDIYENNPLFKHAISHINEFLSKNQNYSDKKTIEILSNFINYDEFSEEIINKILLNGIPESLPCLRPLIWKSLIGFYSFKELSNWEKVSIQKKSDYAKILKKYHKPKYIGNEFVVERNGFSGLKELVRYKLYENEFEEA